MSSSVLVPSSVLLFESPAVRNSEIHELNQSGQEGSRIIGKVCHHQLLHFTPLVCSLFSPVLLFFSISCNDTGGQLVNAGAQCPGAAYLSC